MTIIHEHPAWCDRRHPHNWPVHTQQVGGDIHLTRELTVAIEIQQVGSKPATVMLIEQTPDETSVTEFVTDAAGTLRDLLTEALSAIAGARR